MAATGNWSSARGVVAIGASAGGIDALQRVIPELPEDLQAAICIVLHIPAASRSLLPEIIGRQTPLPVSQAMAGERLRAGHVYVAPPDWHVLVRDRHIRLERGPKENGVRPAIDPLFRSIAEAYGRCAVAVVLSGSLSDGAAGAAAVATTGGTVLVQDPDDAIVPGMPEAALAAVPGAEAFTAAGLTAQITRRVQAFPEIDPEEAAMFAPEPARENNPGPPTGFTCPECHGPLWERRSGAVVRYRCRVGHVFSEEVLLDGKAAAIEAALWMALEALEERGELLEKVAARMEDHGREDRAARLRERARGASERAELIRGVLTIDEAPVERAESESA